MTTQSTPAQSSTARMAAYRRHLLAQAVLADAYTAARLVDYAPGSAEMARLALAETCCRANPNPMADPPPQVPTPRRG